MSEATALLIALVRGANTAMEMAQQLGISEVELEQLMSQARAEGRSLRVADLRDIRTDTDADLESLRAAIAAAQARGE